MAQTDPRSELQEAIRRGGVVVVAGTGVSMAASRNPATGRRPHPQSSWSGLLENGLSWLGERQLMPSKRVDAHRVFLGEGANIHHLVSAAEDVTRCMGGVESKHFGDWLTRTVGSITAYDRTLLDALEALRQGGNLLATTNYDSLLLANQHGLEAVTWTDGDGFLRAVRNKEKDKVLFLHGHWRQPRSVILDWNSYQDVARDEQYRQDLAAVWQLTTWLYVGCGVNGLDDPDFGLLLERYGKRARNAGLWDFCLVLDEQREAFQAYFDQRHFNIRAVAFGNAYDDLPAFLHGLLTPAPDAPPPPPPAPITEFLRVTDVFFQYRPPDAAASGISFSTRGDFRFTAAEFRDGSVHRPQAVDTALERLVREGLVWLEGPSAGGKTTLCLHLVNEWDRRGVEPLYLDLSDEPDAESAAREITAHARRGRMFILDNVHDAPKVAYALLDHWHLQRRDSVMVLVGWPIAVDPRRDYLNGYRHAIVPVVVQAEDWIGVYQSTYRHVRGRTAVPPVPPARVLQDWNDRFAADLVTFQYALAAGLPLDSGNAFRVERAAADRYVREKYLTPCSDDERHDLYLLSWLSQLGMSVAKESTRSGFERSLRYGLIRSNDDTRSAGTTKYQLWHPSLGRMLLSLAPAPLRDRSICEAAASYPQAAGELARSLEKRGEHRLAVAVIDRTLSEHPNVVDWFGDTLNEAAGLLRRLQRLTPEKWPVVARDLGTTDPHRLVSNAFATSLSNLASFLELATQTEELERLWTALTDALVADAALPPHQSRLQAHIFATPLEQLAYFLKFVARTDRLKPVFAAAVNALVTDAALPLERSKLRMTVVNWSAHVVYFLKFAAETEELRPAWVALVDTLAADAALPAAQSTIKSRLLDRPLDQLVHVLNYAAETDRLTAILPSLVDVLTADASLPPDQGRLHAQAFSGSLDQLKHFLKCVSEREEFRPVRMVFTEALVADSVLPAERSLLRRQVLAAPLGQIASFLKFLGQSHELHPVWKQVVTALVTDAALPPESSRVRDLIFTEPLDHLAHFLNLAAQVGELRPVWAAIVDDLTADAAIPANQSRLGPRVANTPPSQLRVFVELVALTDRLRPLRATVINAMAGTAASPAGHEGLPAYVLSGSLEHLMNALDFVAKSAVNPSVRTALVRALVVDAESPSKENRLLTRILATRLSRWPAFFAYLTDTDDLRSLRDAIVQSLATEAALPAAQSRWHAKVFAMSLNQLTVLLTNWMNLDEMRPVSDLVMATLVRDAALPANQSRLFAQLWNGPLLHLSNFLELVGRFEQLTPVRTAIAHWLMADIGLPVDQSRLLEAARATLEQDRRHFVNAARGLPELAEVANLFERSGVSDLQGT